jgi:hypothetical protein
MVCRRANLVVIDQSVIQLVSIGKRLVNNKDISISYNGIIVRRRTGDNGHVFNRLDTGIVCVDFRSPESRGKDNKFLAKQ